MRTEIIAVALRAVMRFTGLSAVGLSVSAWILDQLGQPSGGTFALGLLSFGVFAALQLWGEILSERPWGSRLYGLLFAPILGLFLLATASLSAVALADPAEGPVAAIALATVGPLSGGLTLLSMWRGAAR